MENDINNTEEQIVEKEQPAIAPETTTNTLTKDITTISKITNHLSEQITRTVTSADIIMFAAAFATLPLVDFVAKAFGSLGAATQALYAIIPATAFGLGYWFSRNGQRPVSIFLHSLAAISLIMATISLLPVIPNVAKVLTGPGIVAIGMPILAIIFIFVAAKVPNTGASYIFATIATVILFFLSVAQLLAIPCNNALISGATNAQTICEATPYIQNTLIPVAIFILGWYAFKKNK